MDDCDRGYDVGQTVRHPSILSGFMFSHWFSHDFVEIVWHSTPVIVFWDVVRLCKPKHWMDAGTASQMITCSTDRESHVKQRTLSVGLFRRNGYSFMLCK